MKIAVLGVGSAGIQALCHMLSFFDRNNTIYSIFDPKISTLAVGESTNATFVNALELGTDFEFIEDLHKLDGTIKHCTHWVDWKQTPYNTPLIRGDVAVHFNTLKLKEYALPRLHEKWGDKFVEIHGEISNLSQDSTCVYVTVDGDVLQFDYVIDCRGFPKSFDAYQTVDDLAVNQCMVHSFDETHDWRYTLHKATPDGWMFGIPLTSRTTYGYLFNNTITSEQEAKENFSKEIGIDVNDLKLSKFKFTPYYANKMFDGRIMKNGNTAVFFEPMFANSIHMYDYINKCFLDRVCYGSTEDEVNEMFKTEVNRILLQFYYFYQLGSVYDTPFWKRIEKISKDKLNSSTKFQKLKRQMNEMHIDKYGYLMEGEIDFSALAYVPRILFNLDKKLGLNNWTRK
jgi:hypothetical protein